MTIGNPHYFAIIVNKIDEWNANDDFCNGVLLFCVNGELFPKKVAVATLKCEIQAINEKLNGAVAGQEMRIWTLGDDGSEVPLFSGVIDTATLVSVGGYNRFQIEFSSGTSLMDRQKRNRSFQNANQTYEQIVEQVVSAYAGSSCSTTSTGRSSGSLSVVSRVRWRLCFSISTSSGSDVLLSENSSAGYISHGLGHF